MFQWRTASFAEGLKYDSSVLHCASLTAHKNHVIIWANKRTNCILIHVPG